LIRYYVSLDYTSGLLGCGITTVQRFALVPARLVNKILIGGFDESILSNRGECMNKYLEYYCMTWLFILASGVGVIMVWSMVKLLTGGLCK
jgi:hypothetical protein